MSYRKSLRNIVAVAAFGFMIGSSTIASAADSVQFLDLQWLKPGVTAREAGSYFKDKLSPIVRKHGGNILFVYQVHATMKGDVNPVIVASIDFPSMNEMQALFHDPDYVKIIPQRDATFDLPRQSLFQIAPVGGN